MKMNMKKLSFAVLQALSAGVVVSLAATGVQAQTQSVEKIEVTGSNIKRAESEGALPVLTITREQIENLGVTNIEQLLQTVTSNSAVGGLVAAQGAGQSTYGESAASLRSLGANKTLVLVNGRRLANYATDGTAVDINGIPLGAIDRVEILQDGASAVYGSDAVAGVINFILRENFSGFEATGYAGMTAAGGGRTTKGGLVWGFGDFQKDRFNVMLSADMSKDAAIYGADRSYANQAWDNAGIYGSGSATPSGNYLTFVPTPGVGAPHTLDSLGSNIGNPLSPNNCATNGMRFDPNYGTCRYDPSPFVPLVPDIERQNVSGSFRFKLTNNDEFFINGFYSHQVTDTIEQPSPYRTGFLVTDQRFVTDNVYPAIIVDPTSPYYPTAFIAANKPSAAGQPVTVSYRAFDGGGREHTDVASNAHFVAGFRGGVMGYDYDIAYVHNSSNVAETTQAGYQNQVALATLLSHNPAFNPLAATQTPALAAQIAATNYVGPMISSTLHNDSLEGKLSGELFKLPAGPLSFAVAASLRTETMDLQPSAAYQSGDVSGYGGQVLPLSATRRSSSIFGELNAPIVKSLEADVAVRTDRYPNATSTNPKVSLRFQPVQQALIRASYGTGFREAALPELFTPNTIGTTASFKDPVTGALGQFTQVAGGNPNLKPEKSEQASIGFVLDPVQAMSLSVDYFKIRVRDLIQSLSPQFIVDEAAAGNSTYAALVQRDSGNNITQIMSTLQNAGAIAVSGVDVDFKWLFLKTADYGAYDVRLRGTYMKNFDETLADGSVQHSIGVTVDPSGNPINAAFTGIIFKWRHALSLGWKDGPYALRVTQNYQSSYFDAGPWSGAQDGTDSRHIGAFSTYDLVGAYGGIKNLVLRLGVKNVLDKAPPVATTLGQYFQSGYDPTYYDPHDRFVYVTATYKFK
jgi:iron complex outermembrane receptor protein